MSNRRKECRGRETFEVSESTKLRRDNVLRIQAGAEDTGFTAGAKAETFEAFEVFQVQEEAQAQEGAQLPLDQLERTRSGPLNLCLGKQESAEEENRSGPSDLAQIVDSHRI
jgi:hypothetical protein